MDIFPLLGFIELKTLLVILHLFGVVLGAGIAVFSAAMFMKVMWDGHINKTEINFIQLASLLVACGLFLILTSGIGLFFIDMERYVSSSKFLAKMTIVLILIVNGTLIHSLHIPALKKNVGAYLRNIPDFRIRSVSMYAGGAVSITSWFSALILGTFRGVPYSYQTIMLTYLGALVLAVCVTLLIHHFTFGKMPRADQQ